MRSPIWTARAASAWEQAEPDKLSEAARDLRVCRFSSAYGGVCWRKLGAAEFRTSCGLTSAEWRNGGMADVRQ